MMSNSESDDDFHKKDKVVIKERSRIASKRYREKQKQKFKKLKASSEDSGSEGSFSGSKCNVKSSKNSNNIETDNNINNYYENVGNNNDLTAECVSKNCSDQYSPTQSSNNSDRESSNENNSTSSNDSDLEQENSKKEMLFEGSNTHLFDFLYAMQSFKIKHHLSDDATNDLFKLIKSILPSENKCPNNLNKFEKSLFDDHDGSFYKICNKCIKIADIKPLKDFKSDKSKCKTCNIELIPFIVFDIKQQLEHILKGSKLRQLKQAYLNSNFGSYSDISNPLGAGLYRNFIASKEDDGFSEDLVISLNLNSDGAPITNSKNFSMWPLMATILELDQSTREKFQNIIFLGKNIFII
jgi:hypothetical protein